MHRVFLVCVLACSAASAARVHAQEPSSPLDVTTYGVVYQVPAMKDVVVKADLPYADGARRLDLYLPPASMGRGPWPVVVFANGVGDFEAPRSLKDWEIYRTWARLMAAHGVAAVTMQAEPGKTAERIAQVVEHAAQGRLEGVDPKRLALWSCSGNVNESMPYAMGKAPLRAAVVYYGFGDGAPRTDLPVFYVLAVKDSPNLNAGIRRAWAAAIEANAPWTMLVGRDLPHAFDALVETQDARDLVKETVEFLVRELAEPKPGPAPSVARRALTHSYGWEWTQAADAYGAILQQNPRDRAALRGYSRGLARSGRADEAVAAFRQQIASGTDDADLHNEFANLLVQQKRYAEAVGEYDAALKGGGHAPTLHYNAACALALAGRVDDAFKRLDEAVAAGYTSRAQYENDSDLKPLHADPRWAALLARLVG
jgi:hypothetical protein